MEVSLKGFQCQRCGHEWKPRKAGTPKKCPGCDSSSWQVPRGEGLPPHLDEVFQLYEVPEDQRAEIIRYTCHYPGVAKALRDAVPEIERVFGKGRRRRLDLFQFQDGGGDEQLLGSVLFEKFPQNAFELEQQFDEALSAKIPRAIDVHMSFHIEVEDDYPPI